MASMLFCTLDGSYGGSSLEGVVVIRQEMGHCIGSELSGCGLLSSECGLIL